MAPITLIRRTATVLCICILFSFQSAAQKSLPSLDRLLGFATHTSYQSFSVAAMVEGFSAQGRKSGEGQVEHLHSRTIKDSSHKTAQALIFYERSNGLHGLNFSTDSVRGTSFSSYVSSLTKKAEEKGFKQQTGSPAPTPYGFSRMYTSKDFQLEIHDFKQNGTQMLMVFLFRLKPEE
jgi:hypothetical protein